MTRQHSVEFTGFYAHCSSIMYSLYIARAHAHYTPKNIKCRIEYTHSVACKATAASVLTCIVCYEVAYTLLYTVTHCNLYRAVHHSYLTMLTKCAVY
jgi:hypothetical protein